MQILLKRRLLSAMVAVTLTLPCALARKPGEPIKPGFNLFSKDQDVQLGQQAAAEISKQLNIAESRELQDYVRQIGQRLVQSPAADKYPYTFTAVNDKSINAFALPGGPTFIHSGLIAAADNEAQVAGVIAHEIAHVALRHGTNQASKANLLQIPAMLAGVATGSNLWAGLVNMGAQGFMLKFSRSAETQADQLGARLMAEAGYNPVEMARFFEKLEAEGGSRGPQFLASHPNPGNRVTSVQNEITGLPRGNYRNEVVGGFSRFKSYTASLPPGPKRVGQPGEVASGPAQPIPAPSRRLRTIQGKPYAFSYPDNWQESGDGEGVTVAPREAVMQNGLSHGVIANTFQSQNSRDLRSATQELIQQLSQQNQGLQAVSQPRSVRIDNRNALVTHMRSPSPRGGNERDMLLTVEDGNRVVYLIFVAPENEFRNYDPLYNEIVKSLRLSN